MRVRSKLEMPIFSFPSRKQNKRKQHTDNLNHPKMTSQNSNTSGPKPFSKMTILANNLLICYQGSSQPKGNQQSYKQLCTPRASRRGHRRPGKGCSLKGWLVEMLVCSWVCWWKAWLDEQSIKQIDQQLIKHKFKIDSKLTNKQSERHLGVEY